MVRCTLVQVSQVRYVEQPEVCRPASEVARTIPKPGPAERSGQPLTKSDCDKASMRWDDGANVCGEKLGTQAASKTTSPVPWTLLINIDKTIRDAVRGIGYVNDDDVFHADKIFINNYLTTQSPDISQGVDAKKAHGKKTADKWNQ